MAGIEADFKNGLIDLFQQSLQCGLKLHEAADMGVEFGLMAGDYDKGREKARDLTAGGARISVYKTDEKGAITITKDPVTTGPSASARTTAPAPRCCNARTISRAHTPLPVLGAMLRYLAERAAVPVVVHLDHVYTVADCREAIDAG